MTATRSPRYRSMRVLPCARRAAFGAAGLLALTLSIASGPAGADDGAPPEPKDWVKSARDRVEDMGARVSGWWAGDTEAAEPKGRGACTLSQAEVSQAIAEARDAVDRMRAERDALNEFYWQWYARLGKEGLDCQTFQADYGPMRMRLESMDPGSIQVALQSAYECVVQNREELTRVPPNQAIAARISALHAQRKEIDELVSDLDVIANKRARLAQGFQEVFLNACASFR